MRGLWKAKITGNMSDCMTEKYLFPRGCNTNVSYRTHLALLRFQVMMPRSLLRGISLTLLCHQVQIKFGIYHINKGIYPQCTDAAGAYTADQEEQIEP